MTRFVLERRRFDDLLTALGGEGYRTLGPVRSGAAIGYEPIESAADLPAGWADEQAPGHYRIAATGTGALFGFAASPHSWKRYLHPPAVTLFTAAAGNGETAAPAGGVARRALIGVRPCDLAAIAIQDTVLRDGVFPDRTYTVRRRGVFLVAVNCTRPGGTCFCASMGTGPEAGGGYDLALTEVVAAERHRFLVTTGSPAGEKLAAVLELEPAPQELIVAAQEVLARARARMGRELDTDGLPGLVARNARHPRWEEVAQRCLACGNCTMACPTCFCTTVEDVAGLDGSASRIRRWESCFTGNFTYMHGGSLRTSTASRYRQWLTHKVSSWVDQFGTSGCVGCGRCITWCPVGIDITAELAALREGEEEARVRARVIP